MRAFLSLGIFLALAIPATSASWLDNAAVSGATLTAGTVDLKVNNGDGTTTFTGLNMSDMEPGDSVAAVLTVQNVGTAALHYYVDATATNSLGSTLVAKVTSDATTDGRTCSGAALAVSGSTFGANLVGTAASPRTLAVGGSEKLCVQATLPSTAEAWGGSTAISLTFTASTGSGGTGWTDNVAMSGTSLSAMNGLYLGTDGTGDSASPPQGLPLRRTAPTLTTLFDYDTTHTPAYPGLTVNSGRTQYWFFTVGSTPFRLSTSFKLRIWSAVEGFSRASGGGLQVNLLDCTASLSCSTLYGTAPSFTGSPWSGGSNTWVSKTFNVPAPPLGSYTWQPGRLFVLGITAQTSANMMLAYDTTTYRSALIFP